KTLKGTALRCPVRYEANVTVLSADTGHEVRLHRQRLAQISRLFPSAGSRVRVWPNDELPQVKLQTYSPDGDDANLGLDEFAGGRSAQEASGGGNKAITKVGGVEDVAAGAVLGAIGAVNETVDLAGVAGNAAGNALFLLVRAA